MTWPVIIAFIAGAAGGALVMFERMSEAVARAGRTSWKWESECYEWRDAARIVAAHKADRKGTDHGA